MKKRTLFITILIILATLSFTLGLVGCGNKSKGKLEKVTLVVDKTEVDVGDTINLSFTTNPKKPEYSHNGETYKAECIEYFTRIDGVDTRISRQTSTTTYTFNTAKEVTFWAKYCDHSLHSGVEDDIVSNFVTVKIKTNPISNAQELKAVANSDKAYVLTSDIDLSSEANWQPIEGFKGVLNGDGYIIANLTINAVNLENIGLFGTLEGTVEDLTFKNASITARGDAGKAGIVAGTNKGVISNVTVEGTVAPEYYGSVGGIVGYNNLGKITDCVNKAQVTGANNVGGIAGEVLVNASNMLTDLTNKGIIEGKDKVGGIAGYITCNRSNNTYQIKNMLNESAISGKNSVGGIFGEVYAFYDRYNYSDYYSYFDMSVLTNRGVVTGSTTGNDTGGLIGKANNLKTLTACENTADITGGTCVGGFVGNAPNTNIKATGAVNENKITGKGKIGGFAGYAGVIENAINEGEIVSTGVIIEDSNTRSYVGGIAGYCTGLISCENKSDITVDSKGTFVGGLAGYVYVKTNNTLDGNINRGDIKGADDVGGIAGYVTCGRSNATYEVSNNENSGAITGDNDVGGIFGEVYAFHEWYNYSDYYSYFSMSVLTNKGVVNGSLSGKNTAGLIGKANNLKLLTTSDNLADITGGDWVGGFVGYAPKANIKATGSKNANTITGKTYVGAFAGNAGVIEYAINNGTVIATGKDTEGKTYVGGIAGYCTGAIGCVNNGAITLENGGIYVGGIAGYIYLSETNVVHDNENNAKIKGTEYVGGIVGYISCTRSNATYKVTDNLNSNTITGTKYVSGIIGYAYGYHEWYNYSDYYSYFEITNCTNMSMIMGESNYGGICGGYNNLKTDDNIMNTNTSLHADKLGQ